ncbi:MFS family permease [Kribbella aluminosa]|uniref:MFS family permease n=1 Tax=Kribbella aluminosa TaxID=416017 RepID=A0ABS4UVS4_9ACTN|nr:MFS transporter [Kribbella aluminosa]MBP2355744.1 MFS family permease [Kribbella aluminosa]
MTSRTRLLLPATFITSLGNNIQLLGAALLLVRAHGSMLDVGWLFIAVAVPQAVLSPYFGRLADRFDRRRLWVVCDVLSAGVALALPVGLALGVPQQPLVYATNFALAVIAAQFTPASAALIRERVAADRLRHFNAHYEIALQSGMLLSAAVGGVALQYFGPQPLFTFNACTFALSALLVAAVGAKRGTVVPIKPLPVLHPTNRGQVLGLGPLVVLFGQGLVVVTVFNALMPVLVVGEWHRGAGVLGVTDALGGVGFLLAATVYRWSGKWLGDLRLAVGGFLVCSGLLVLQPLFGVPALMGLVLLGAFLFGQSRIATRSLLMTSVDESRVGHAFGVANGYGLAATVVVMLIASLVTGRSDTRFGFAVLALIGVLSAILAAVWISTISRRAASNQHEPRPVVRSPGGAL